MRQALEAIFKERSNLAEALKDTDSIVHVSWLLKCWACVVPWCLYNINLLHADHKYSKSEACRGVIALPWWYGVILLTCRCALCVHAMPCMSKSHGVSITYSWLYHLAWTEIRFLMMMKFVWSFPTYLFVCRVLSMQWGHCCMSFSWVSTSQCSRWRFSR